MGFKLFGKKKLKKPINLDILGVDMHSHLIAGIDDGAKTIENSLELIRDLNNAGYKKLITTPHIQHEFFQNTPEIILNGLNDLRIAVKDAGIPVEIEAAAEYLVDEGFSSKIENGNLLSFGDKYILIEFSYFNPHPDYKNVIFNLQVDGYKVILAHPERYSYWFNDFKKFEDLKDRGVFFQVNMISLAGHYPDPVKKIAESFIEKGMVEFLGSDMHNMHYMNSLQKSRIETILDKAIKSGKLLNHTL